MAFYIYIAVSNSRKTRVKTYNMYFVYFVTLYQVRIAILTVLYDDVCYVNRICLYKNVFAYINHKLFHSRLRVVMLVTFLCDFWL